MADVQSSSEANVVTLRVERPESKTDERAVAETVLEGFALNTVTAVEYSRRHFGIWSLNDGVAVLKESALAASAGDLSNAEALLSAQIASLNVIYTDLAQRAAHCLADHPELSERLLKLAFKAQSQCRATVETLAAVKNPPVVFARQANIANGPQQVNNGPSASSGHPARAGEIENRQNELLDCEYGERVDSRTKVAAFEGYSQMASVGEIDRSEDKFR